MSNALAIAGVSAVLLDLLNNGVIDHDISASVGDVIVTALPPDKIATDSNERSQLNLFLYQVTPNIGWRNEGLPSRDQQGNRLTNPPMALDLHYLLSAYGAQDLHPEILLGVGMQTLHETPVLPRAAIRRSLAPPTFVGPGGGLPPQLQNLFTSGLADQVEQIKIAPFCLSTEEIYRLWTAFQARYRPSSAYQVTVVLIQSNRGTKTSLPVLKRKIFVQPFKSPSIDRVLSQATANDPILDQPILPGFNLVLQGSNLQGDDTVVRIGDFIVTPDPASITDTQIIVPLPDGLLAGVQAVQVIQRIDMGSPPVPHLGFESNAAAFVLRPVLVSISAVNIVSTGGLISADVTVFLSPNLGPSQRAVLLLNQTNVAAGTEPQSYAFGEPLFGITSPPVVFSPPGVSNQVTIQVSDVVPGTYLARIQVDGAQSLLTVDSSGQFNGPLVTLA
jgi:hypothetical protein